jgi:hypothetical protein
LIMSSLFISFFISFFAIQTPQAHICAWRGQIGPKARFGRS